ncbi:MAG: hypothetical protein ABIC82_02760 [bacterium]
MTSKKIIFILSTSIFIFFFTIFGYCILFKKNNRIIPIAQECPKIKNLEAKPAEENLDTKQMEEWEPKEWNTYYDERYKYIIDFPSGLNVTTTHEDTVELSEYLGGGFLTTNGGVSFFPSDFPGIMGAKIFEDSKFRSPDEWFKNGNSKEINRIVEKKISIDGNEAIVTYPVSMLDGKILEEYKYEKITAFIKDGILFLIWTKFRNDGDNEKAWNSFKFITDRYPVY